MAMASSTPKHLFDVGLMSKLVEDEQVRAKQGPGTGVGKALEQNCG